MHWLCSLFISSPHSTSQHMFKLSRIFFIVFCTFNVKFLLRTTPNWKWYGTVTRGDWRWVDWRRKCAQKAKNYVSQQHRLHQPSHALSDHNRAPRGITHRRPHTTSACIHRNPASWWVPFEIKLPFIVLRRSIIAVTTLCQFILATPLSSLLA